jgi:putative DNA primase/helicase
VSPAPANRGGDRDQRHRSAVTAAAILTARCCGQPGCVCAISTWRGSGLTHCPAPGHGKGQGDRSPSLSIRPGERADLLTCFGGCARGAVVAALRDELSSTDPDGLPRAARAASSALPATTVELVGRLWSEGLPDHPRLGAYLGHRGLSGYVPAALRLHPMLAYHELGQATRRFPAMVARFQHPDGTTTGLHRTWLDATGPGKASVSSPKRFLGRVAGAAVHLSEPTDGRLAVTEGIETGLAVLEARGVAVWAAGSALGVAALELPDGLVRLEVWADPDRVGRDAAVALARRAQRVGIEVGVYVPPGDGA